MAASGTSTDCLPTWHPYLALVVQSADVRVKSGCVLNDQGNIPCTPESLRAKAEAALRASGWWTSPKPLTLDTYTLARVIQSEYGSGTPEERVAIGEVYANNATRRKRSITASLINGNPSKYPVNNGFYGPIHGTTDGKTDFQKHDYGRYASTAQDPTVANLIIADFVVSGKSNNFTRGADDQAAYGEVRAYPDPASTFRYQATQGGSYWVGPLPNVNHLATTLMSHVGYKPTSIEGAFLLQRAINAFVGRQKPNWSNLAVCVPPPTVKASFTALPTETRAWLSLLAVGGFGVGLVLGRRHGPSGAAV